MIYYNYFHSISISPPPQAQKEAVPPPDWVVRDIELEALAVDSALIHEVYGGKMTFLSG